MGYNLIGLTPIFAQVNKVRMISQHVFDVSVYTADVQTKAVLVDGNAYSKFTFSHSENSQSQSDPAIPLKSLFVGIPESATLRVEVLQTTQAKVPPLNIYPFTSGQDAASTRTKVLEKLSGRPYPAQVAWVSGYSHIGSQAVAKVSVAPIQVLSSQKAIHNVTIKLRFTIIESPVSKNKITKRQLRTSYLDEHFLQKKLLNYETSKVWRLPEQPEALSGKPGHSGRTSLSINDDYAWYNPTNPYVKIYVLKEGLHVITKDDLVGAGVNVSTIVPQTLKLFYKGNQVPIKVSGEADTTFATSGAIEFLGDFNRGDAEPVIDPNTGDSIGFAKDFYNKYSDTTVFYLTWGGEAGKRFPTVSSGSATTQVTSFQTVRHLETDAIYTLGMVSGFSTENVLGEGWRWRTFQASNVADELDTTFVLDGRYASGASSVGFKVRLIGTALDLPGYQGLHVMDFYINNTVIGTISFNNKKDTIFQTTFPASVLQKGSNGLKIVLRQNDPLTSTNVVDLDWIELTYNRDYSYPVSETNALKFSGDGTASMVQYQLTGLTGADSTSLYNLSDSAIVIGASIGANGLMFSGFNNKTYLAVKTSQKYRPVLLKVNQNASLRNASNSADYIIITHPAFLAQANNLAQYRQSKNGLRTKVVTTEDIYTEFSYGIYSPYAIKAFLKYAFQNWQSPSPKYALLLGGGTWDPKGNMKSPDITFTGKKPFIPAYGNPVSDTWYASFDNAIPFRNVPKMAIGRLPAQSVTEANNMVNKIISYETTYNQPMPWDKNFMFINGGIGVDEQSLFKQEVGQLLQVVQPNPLAAAIDTLYRDDQSPYPTSQLSTSIVSGLQSGAIMANYFGHGGSLTWDVSLTDPQAIYNVGRYPFIFSWTCHTGRFAEPYSRTYCELFMTPAQQGAIGFVGTAGWGVSSEDYIMSQYVYENVRDTVRFLGNIFYNAVENYAASQTSWSEYSEMIIDQYNLQGDPATTLLLSSTPELIMLPENITFKNTAITDNQKQPLGVKVLNAGLVPRDSVRVTIYDAYNSATNFLLVKDTTIRPTRISDSISVLLDFTGKPGTHTIRVVLDEFNRIPESNKNDNAAAIQVSVYSSDIGGILPPAFAVLPTTTGYTQLSAYNPSSTSLQPRFYSFEIDTSGSFLQPLYTSPLVPEQRLKTVWQAPVTPINNQTTFFWRVRVLSSGQVGQWQKGNFRLDASSTLNGTTTPSWQQRGTAQLSQNALTRAVVTDSGAAVFGEQIPVQIRSRCENFQGMPNIFYLIQVGDSVFSQVNDNPNYQNGPWSRGINVVVVDTSNGLSVSSVTSYDLIGDFEAANHLAGFINSLPSNKILVAALEDAMQVTDAIPDTLKNAFASLGSQFFSSLSYKESWVFAGSKNKQFYLEDFGNRCPSTPLVSCDVVGRETAIQTNITLKNKSAYIATDPIGIASAWQRLSWEQRNPTPATKIQVQITGIRSDGSGEDSLATTDQAAGYSLAAINATRYPSLRLKAILQPDIQQGLSPTLQSWRVDYIGAADPAIDNTLLTTTADTINVGSPLTANFQIYNVGYAIAESLKVSLTLQGTQGNVTALANFYVDTIGVNSNRMFHQDIATAGLLGSQTLTVKLNPDGTANELNKTNNTAFKTFWVRGDTAKPKISVLFDGKTILNGDYVVPKPKITITMSDQSLLLLTDTSSISLTLNGSPFYYSQTQGGQGADGNPVTGKLSFTSAVAGKNSAIVTFLPQLPDGNYTLSVAGKDVSGIKADSLGVIFQVSSQMQVSSLYNYPNPMKDKTKFAFLLTGSSDNLPTEFKIKIYTVAGRLVRDLDVLPAIQGVGYSSVEWDGRDKDGDQLANGVYIYRVVIRSKDKTITKTEKLAIVR
jgi:hypothetical protein